MNKLTATLTLSSSARVSAAIEIPLNECFPLRASGASNDSQSVFVRLSVEMTAIESPQVNIPQARPDRNGGSAPLRPQAGNASTGGAYANEDNDFEKYWLDYSGECG